MAVLVWYSLIGQTSAYPALTFVDLLLALGVPATSDRLSRASFMSYISAHNSAMQRRAFSVVGPLVWNDLPMALRSHPRVFTLKVLQQLKTTLFGFAGVGSASE